MLKHHLAGGVAKGAFDEEEAEKRFQEWLKDKQKRIDEKSSMVEKQLQEAKAKAIENEKLANDARIKAQKKL